jgi:hypothetical protein
MIIQVCLIALIPLLFIVFIFKLHQIFQWKWFEGVLSKVDEVLNWRRPSPHHNGSVDRRRSIYRRSLQELHILRFGNSADLYD